MKVWGTRIILPDLILKDWGPELPDILKDCPLPAAGGGMKNRGVPPLAAPALLLLLLLLPAAALLLLLLLLILLLGLFWFSQVNIGGGGP